MSYHHSDAVGFDRIVSTDGNQNLQNSGKFEANNASEMVNPLWLLHIALEGEPCELRTSGSEEICAFPSLNCYIASNTPSGFESKRKEKYSVADVWLLLSTPKDEYTYNFVNEKGHRYINVSARQNIVQTFQDISGGAYARGDGCLVAKEDLGMTTVASGPITVAGMQKLFPLDATTPMRLPWKVKESAKSESEHLMSQWISSNTWILPQWPDSSFLEMKIKAPSIMKKAKHLEQTKNNESTTNCTRQRDFFLAFDLVRIQRPVLLRSSSVLLPDVDFSPTLEEFQAVERERKLKRPLAQFSFNPSPEQQRSEPIGTHHKAMNYSSRPSPYSREVQNRAGSLATKTQQGPRYCLLDDICVKYRRKPIILVPSFTASGGQSIVTKENIVQLLERSSFISPLQAQREALSNDEGVERKEYGDQQTITGTIKGKEYRFLVMDLASTARFSETDWRCVVAVILGSGSSGALKWCFNGWPFRDWVDLFLTYKGVVFAYDEDALPLEVMQWNVKVFRLSRRRRYNDASAVSQFWSHMEPFLLEPPQRRLCFETRLNIKEGARL